MDKDNYEQQFMQNVKNATPTKRPDLPKPKQSSSLPLITSLILAIIVLFESMALVVALVNLFNDNNDETEIIYNTGEDADEYYSYDDKGDVSAFSVTCTSEDGAQYIFEKNQQYKVYDNESELLDSGTYSIIRSDIIVLGESAEENKNLFYDGVNIIDNLVFYECEDGIFTD